MVKIRKIQFVKKGLYIKYLVPRYLCKFMDRKADDSWFKEYELDAVINFDCM